jgi:acyl transferase domain-containing protein/3-hydroxymyristoyl/3-hydroxydecanoyl-(acyl carrier protein) dehydratase
MKFSPVAIVGQGCVLPGALTPEQLWALVHEERSAISAPPEGHWRVSPRVAPGQLEREIASDAGGYVRGFDAAFDPGGFLLGEDAIVGLDPVFTWTLHAAREALRSARIAVGEVRPKGVVVLGNLSYPTPALIELALEVWEGTEPKIDRRNRFMSGLPAQLVARALGFGGGAFAIDAACASSLYAIKLACDRLHDGTADVALAGGVNHADDLFLHLGFTALSALSPTGRSRPFHRQADGLVPAQGAAVVALKRLADAEEAGDRILGVIRAVGLSNDGRSRGLLVPSEEGQVRAMRAAYTMSGLHPADISLVECHATGTQVGDATEMRSLRTVFEANADLALGSLKSNLGHLITASGTAGLIKVMAAMREGVRPRTLHAEEPVADVEAGPLRLLQTSEPWPTDGPRRAAINNFGFGGNNAHLIVEEWVSRAAASATRPEIAPAARRGEIAVVAQTVTAGSVTSATQLQEALLAGRTSVEGDPAHAPAKAFDLDVAGLHFTPADLKEAFPQQTLLLRAAVDLADVIARLPRARTSLLVGMQCDAEGARCSLRWRHPGASAGAATAAPLTSASAVGCMPNVVANRISHQLDLGAPSFTVSAEEASGTVALDLAVRSLQAGEIDAALVGAVDLSCERVQRAAADALLAEPSRTPGDAAVLLVLKRLEDAHRDGDDVLAVLGSTTSETAPEASLRLEAGTAGATLPSFFGHAHAASGLLVVSAAVAACDRRAQFARAGRPAMPWLPVDGERRAQIDVAALGGATTRTTVRAHRGGEARHFPMGPLLKVYRADDMDGLLGALARREPSRSGSFRVAIVASGQAELETRIARAAELLRAHRGSTHAATLDEGIHFGADPMSGELAFVFTGPAGAYLEMGRDLALGLPELVDSLAARSGSLRDAAGWVYDEVAPFQPSPTQKLWASSYLCQLHSELTRGLLEMRPQASIGYCSGESNALFALEAWTDLDGFRRAIDEMGVYSRELCGELRALRRAWEVPEREPVAWSTVRVRAPVEAVRAAIASEPRVHLTIVSGPSDVVIAGDPAGCARVAARIGVVKTTALGYDFVIHCPEAQAFGAEWRALHHRPTTKVPGVRFYTHATGGSYEASAEAAADALHGQAMRTIDFPALVERAYADGVRVFVEHGPHAGCTKWIDEVLGSREHLAVPLDRYGRSSLVQALESTARLVAAGVPMNHGALEERLVERPSAMVTKAAAPRRSLMMRFSAHPDPVTFPVADPATPAGPTAEQRRDDVGAPQIMPPAPRVPFSGGAPMAWPPSGPQGRQRPGEHRAILSGREAPANGGSGLAQTMMNTHQGRLAELHMAFLRQQADVQAQFTRLLLAPLSWQGGPRTPGHLPVAETKALTNVAAPSLAVPVAVPATATVPAVATKAARGPVGPRFDRTQLETLASGQISSVFGPIFRPQDGYTRQVRMPEPPLLLADRVLGIDGAPGEMGTGIIWTQTDIASDAWYLHEGRMPAGILVESGQADLLLISWLGVDLLNRGERVYRLLGCDLVSHGELPKPGDTLTYDIHVDGHANQGDVRLFFFHYDCHVNGKLLVTVRNGQAGFFTDEELRASAGILWRASDATPTEGARLDPPTVVCTRDRFGVEDLDAFVDGKASACFGPGFERADTHTRTPAIQGGRMRLVDEVTRFDRAGGPWGRGYLRARLALKPDHWFFKGHFKNDPCMPGTLMFEGCLQAMSIYLAALGYTLERDGWRFEPVTDHNYALRCRGQALPSSKEVIYEVFVDEIVGGPRPMLYADLLGTVDGLPAFHCRRMGLALVPAWPLDEGRMAQPAEAVGKPVARVNGFDFGYRSLLACAWGKPSEAFGEMYRPFDGTRRAARLPGPPYHFMSRVRRVDGPIGGMQVGSDVEVEYDLPPDAWYFDANGCRTMPYSVLLEVALQPCGWLASYVGSACTSETDLVFRNLDGTGAVHREVRSEDTCLVTTAKVTSLSTAGGLIILGFDVCVRAGQSVVYEFKTVFGFFTADAMRGQVGLATSAAERAAFAEASDVNIDLGERPARFFGGTLQLAGEQLLMIDRVTGLWRTGGKAGKGRVRAEKDIDAAAWFFKAHFFQDPVQPGSLGLEAMIQALQVLMIDLGMGEGIAEPRFEALATGKPMTWKYRGQVVPENVLVTADLEITASGEDERGRFAVAEGSLWVDGKRIYHAEGMAVRIVSGG